MNYNFRDLWRPKMHAPRIFSPARADYPAQIIRRSWVAMSVVDFASLSLRAIAHVNAPPGEADRFEIEAIDLMGSQISNAIVDIGGVIEEVSPARLTIH